MKIQYLLNQGSEVNSERKIDRPVVK